MDDFNENKFKELIVYIARRLGPEAALGRVKLAKLLMVSDFGAYERLGRSMTGAVYEKWEHGHMPRQMVLAQRDLESGGDIRVESVNYFGKKLNHITAKRDPDLGEFSEDELAVIEKTLHLFGFESAAFLSGQSHLELGWRLAEWKEPIPYRTVFLGAGRISEADIRRGEELASSHGWN